MLPILHNVFSFNLISKIDVNLHWTVSLYFVVRTDREVCVCKTCNLTV